MGGHDATSLGPGWISGVTANASQGASFLSQESLNLIANAVLDKCDTLDGVEDRVLENPLACTFDLDKLACTTPATNSSSCLTSEQLTAAKNIYAGPRHSQSNTSFYPGFDMGSESEWMMQEGRLSLSFSLPLLQNMVFDDLNYNGSTFDWASDVDALDLKVGSLIDSISPNLTSFKDRGGKLLVTQGWADPFNAATWPIDHLNEITQVTGGDRDEWLSLFMVPGKLRLVAAIMWPSLSARLTSFFIRWWPLRRCLELYSRSRETKLPRSPGRVGGAEEGS